MSDCTGTGKRQVFRSPERAEGRRRHHNTNKGQFLSFPGPWCRRWSQTAKRSPLQDSFSKTPAGWSHTNATQQPAAPTISTLPLPITPEPRPAPLLYPKRASRPPPQVKHATPGSLHHHTRSFNNNMKQLNQLPGLCKALVQKHELCSLVCNNIWCIAKGRHYGST